MTRKAIVPPGSCDAADSLMLSQGVASNGHLFITGMTGSNTDGMMPEDPETQMRNAFGKIGAVLHEARPTFDAIVEMTTYHIGLRDHFDLFQTVRRAHLCALWPAWTAVEVAGLRRPGAVIEVRVIAGLDTED